MYITKHAKLLFLLSFCSLIFQQATVQGQSVYGGFQKIDKSDGLYHTSIRTIYEDSKGFVWIGSSDGLMRSDGLFYDIFRKNNSNSSTLSDNTINCIVEDANDYVFWVGTSIGGINRFNISAKESAHYYIEPDSDNILGMVRINAICQINKNKFLVGTQSQGMYYFYPEQNKFVKFETTFKSSYKLPNIIHRIVTSNYFIWVTTSKGLIQFNLQGEFLKAYFFTGESFADVPCEKSCDIMDIMDKDTDNIVFTSKNTLYQFNWQTYTISKLFEAPAGVRLNYLSQDNKGGFWIGSFMNGLFYFNINNNEKAHYNKENTHGLISNNQISDLVICQNKSILWVATKTGLSKYDYHQSKFKQVNLPLLSNGEVTEAFTLVKDAKGGYWVVTKNGLFRKSIHDKYFSQVEIGHNVIIYRAIEDENANLWFTTNKGLLSYYPDSQKYTLHHFNSDTLDNVRLNYITALTPVVDDHLWLLSKVALIKLNTQTFDYELYPFHSSSQNPINYRFATIKYATDNKSLWMGNRMGELFNFNIENKSFSTVNIRKMVNEDIRKSCILLDLSISKDGKVWMATYGNGLLVYDPVKDSVSTQLANGMLESYVYGIEADDNDNFWISSNLGISKVNSISYKTTNYSLDDGTYCNEFNEMAHSRSADGNLLFGGIDGFIEFNPDKLYVNNYKPKVYINSYLVDDKPPVFGDDIFEDVTYYSDSVITITSGSKIKFYASVLNFSNSRRNKIKWKLEGFDEDWREDYSFTSIAYNTLKSGKYKLVVKGMNNDGIESDGEASLELIVKAKYYETNLFKGILVGIICFVIILLIRIRMLWHISQEDLLKNKVIEQTKELTAANEKLATSKEKILNQKTELEIHRNYLENIVEVRTADLEQAKLKAEESDKLKTSFLANMSHEIRTPMNAIIGFSSLLQTDDFTEDQRNHFLNVIHQSSESLLVLINDIIDISRIETGNIEIIEHETHIPTLVKEISDELLFEEKSNDVRFMQFYELTHEDLSIYIDRYRLKQIISNLLRNAFKFTKKGHVKLTVRSVSADILKRMGFALNDQADEDTFHPILFIVEDTGIGIRKEDLKLIFEPFQKAQEYDKVYKGMGLGLSIVTNLLKLFDGGIQVNSEPRVGTEFCFYVNAKRHLK
jgi:signal transduction histidine kinase